MEHVQRPGKYTHGGAEMEIPLTTTPPQPPTRPLTPPPQNAQHTLVRLACSRTCAFTLVRPATPPLYNSWQHWRTCMSTTRLGCATDTRPASRWVCCCVNLSLRALAIPPRYASAQGPSVSYKRPRCHPSPDIAHYNVSTLRVTSHTGIGNLSHIVPTHIFVTISPAPPLLLVATAGCAAAHAGLLHWAATAR